MTVALHLKKEKEIYAFSELSVVTHNKNNNILNGKVLDEKRKRKVCTDIDLNKKI